MSRIQIIEIEAKDDILLEQLKPLFLHLHQYMEECGMKFPLIKEGEKKWVESVKKSLRHFGKLIVAVKDDRVIGFGYGIIKLTPEHIGTEKVGSITHFYVSPDSRKNGVGKKIAIKLENWFEKQNVHSLELQITCGNSLGMAFWKALGYEPELVQMRKMKQS